MPAHPVRERAYLEARLLEEMERGWRYGRSFTLLIFRKAVVAGLPSQERLNRVLGILAPLIRASDILVSVDDSTIVGLLVEADASKAGVAIRRIDAVMSRLPKWERQWDMTVLGYPADSPQIEALPFFEAP
jgi:hypothetical protein